MKLHSLLAVDQNLRSQAEATRRELSGTFAKKGHHFTKRVSTYQPLAEDAEARTEEQLDLQSTVALELTWISAKIAAAIDVGYQVDCANQTATADVKLDDGTALLGALPATALLQLEKRLVEVQELITVIPTLDPAKGFQSDPAEGSYVFRARDVVKPRTEKTVQPLTLYPATEKHPAQVQAISVDKVVGHVTTREWSGLITVSDKGGMLDRVEELIRAVKKARSRANEVEINERDFRIGQRLLDFVFNGKK